MRQTDRPGVDVLIPTRDRPAALVATLATLLGQTHRPLRIVVSDQGDECCLRSAEVRALVRTLRLDRVPIEVLRHLPRRGMAEHRQFLLDQARGRLALFLDDDVLLEPTLVDRLVRAIMRERCGFIGSFANAPSAVSSTKPADQPPPDLYIEEWRGPVRPERLSVNSPGWERARLHFAAYPLRVAQRQGLDGATDRLYRVAWVGGCWLVDVAKLRTVGGFEFWRHLPTEHSGEDVVAQLRLMHRFGGAGLLPSGAWHQEVRTTRSGSEPDAPDLLDQQISSGEPPPRSTTLPRPNRATP